MLVLFMSGKIMIAGVDNSVHHTMKLMIQNQTFSTLLCFIFSSLTLTYGLSSILFSYVRIFDSCALCENFSRSVIQLTATPTTRIRKRRYARRSFFSCGLISLHLPTMPLRNCRCSLVGDMVSKKRALLIASLSNKEWDACAKRRHC